MIPNDQHPKNFTPRWSEEEQRLLRLMAEIRLEVAECTNPRQLVSLALQYNILTAHCVALHIFHAPSNLEEIEEVKTS